MKEKAYWLQYTLLAFLLLFFTSCEDDKTSSDDDLDISPTIEWIENTLRGDYLWSNEIPSKPDYTLEATDFFYSLLSDNDGKENYFYSYISENKDFVTKAIDEESTYGFEFALYNIVDDYGRPLGYYYGRVLYVLPDSPAEQANLKRGQWIIFIDDKNITEDNYLQLFNGDGTTFSVVDRMTEDAGLHNVTLTASTPMVEDPFYLNTVINTADGKKVGYMLYNKFTTGPTDDPYDETYHNRMKEIFKDKFSNIDEFVLDLRFNGGGYMTCAQLLAGLIIPEAYKNQTFCISKDNKNKSYSYKFTDGGSHLNINRLFVLVSNNTASASELIINCLRPYFGNKNVILIGEQTEGKNVGSVEYKDNKYEWILQPITFRIFNKNNESDYENGFTPNYIIDELGTVEYGYFPDLSAFGDKNEILLNKALSIISGTPSTAKSFTKNNASNLKIKPSSLHFNSLSKKKPHSGLIVERRTE